MTLMTSMGLSKLFLYFMFNSMQHAQISWTILAVACYNKSSHRVEPQVVNIQVGQNNVRGNNMFGVSAKVH